MTFQCPRCVRRDGDTGRHRDGTGSNRSEALSGVVFSPVETFSRRPRMGAGIYLTEDPTFLLDGTARKEEVRLLNGLADTRSCFLSQLESNWQRRDATAAFPRLLARLGA